MNYLGGAYAYYCDDNNLKRINATPEEHIRNLNQLINAARADIELEKLKIIQRCPTCGGTGKRHVE